MAKAADGDPRIVETLLLANRIMVIGCSGSGKSTLSRKISALCNLPHVSMDREIFWLPGWVQRDKGEQRALIEKVAQGERWIMDGTHPSSFDIRVPRADLVLWIRLPRRLSLFSALKRTVSLYGRTRPEMAPGCPERFDFDFLRYIWSFETIMVPKIEKALADANIQVPVVTLRSFADINRLMEALRLEKTRNAQV